MTKHSKVKPALPDPAEHGARTKILNAALQEFARLGLSGARVDAITLESGINKGMIYYCFGNKECLYVAALEESYRRFRQIESDIDVDSLATVPALQALVRATFNAHVAHPEFTRMVMSENINRDEYIRKIPELRTINRSAITLLDRLCQRSAEEGAFRKNIDTVDLHMSISALAFYNVPNRDTFSFIFDRDVGAAGIHAARRASVIDTILCAVAA